VKKKLLSDANMYMNMNDIQTAVKVNKEFGAHRRRRCELRVGNFMDKN
jgi:hypothetical protein